MTPKDPGFVSCAKPGCPNQVASGTGPGRRRKYCSEACGRAVRKIRSSQRIPDTKAHDEDARHVVDDLAVRVAVLREQIYAGEALAGLRQVVTLSSEVNDVTAAVVQQARDRGYKGPAIAKALSMTVDKVGRTYSAECVIRRMAKRRDRRPAGPPPPFPARTDPPPAFARTDPSMPSGRHAALTPGSRTGVDGEGRCTGGVRHSGQRRSYSGGGAGAGGAAGPDNGPPGQDSVRALASALSHLQRTSDKTLKALGGEARVSASYISRILSGERSPSWKVTRRMVHACGGDPEAIRPLWDAAHGRRLARAGSLHAALRGLYLSAACPDLVQIRVSSGNIVTEREITGLLHGSLVPDWETVGRIVGVLHGRPDDIRPLWDHARMAQLAPTECGLVPERHTPRAEAFG
ncbi:helix-turn-helix transcriptional regulator [Streptomyces sp. CT34]|uniref:helix-turn-helix domain-containing protein n=1 Tax=Streptomyces sp. CT34 TaxID=1553907 RepID=UPI00099C5687|nr:helix-turn-helix transcriptional regulator [Streptomyces sp. CT34]